VTQAFVFQPYMFVTVTIAVETSLMNETAVSDVSVYFTSNFLEHFRYSISGIVSESLIFGFAQHCWFPINVL